MENGGISAIRNEIRAQVVVLPNVDKIPKTKTSVEEHLKVEDKQEGPKQEVISPPATVPAPRGKGFSAGFHEEVDLVGKV